MTNFPDFLLEKMILKDAVYISEKHNFVFIEITNAITDWILKVYPGITVLIDGVVKCKGRICGKHETIKYGDKLTVAFEKPPYIEPFKKYKIKLIFNTINEFSMEFEREVSLK